MLTICDSHHRMNRRELLRIGSLGLGGLSLASLLGVKASAGSFDSSGPLRDKSVIFLFQQGGPSQHETFDPKTEAPSGIRTVTGVTQTSVPGVWFGDTLEQLSALAHKLTVVRSFQTNNAGHNIQPMVGPDSLDTNIGVHYARIAGPTRPSTGIRRTPSCTTTRSIRRCPRATPGGTSRPPVAMARALRRLCQGPKATCSATCG